MRSLTLYTFTLLFSFVSLISEAQSQPRYLVLFKDKTNSPFSVSKPEAFLSERAISRRTRQNVPITSDDLPVNPSYITQVNQTGAKVIFPTKWFNGVLVEASEAQLTAIKALSFFKSVELNRAISESGAAGVARKNGMLDKLGTTEDLDYGRMRAQLVLLGADQLHNKGFHGENQLIAILDAGFNRSNELSYLKHIFDENRVVDTQDFVARDGNVYNDHWHGNAVLSTIAAYQPGSMIGVAYKAQFALYRTENAETESPYEEVTWLAGAERADSLGADVINTSLGYFEFDDPTLSYTYADMDGKTTIISRAARYATRKGIIVVNAAGNEGNGSWKYITAPADVDSVLTVGACNYDKSYAALSSIGPNAAGQLKPDVAAVGSGTVIGNNVGTGSVSTGSGTSFASPQIAGLAAILWQAHPNLNAQDIIRVLKESGNQAANPDNLLGYGVPDMTEAEEIIEKEYPVLGTEPDFLSSIELAPNPVANNITLRVPSYWNGKNVRFNVLSSGGKTLVSSNQSLMELTIIPTEQLSTGLYLLQIVSGDSQRIMRFIKR